MNHFYSILGILLFQNPICPDTNLHRSFQATLDRRQNN